MVNVNVGGCSSFVKDADFQKYVEKALAAFDVLDAESGAGNDFLGWKTLPIDIPETLIADCEAIRDDWSAKGVDLVIVIGIGGSYLGARCAIEALSHGFVRKSGVPQIAFAGNNLSEDYLAELMDLARMRNTACVVISKSGTTTEPAVASASSRNSSSRPTARPKPLPASWPSPMPRRAPSRPWPRRRDTNPSSCPTMSAAATPS